MVTVVSMVSRAAVSAAVAIAVAVTSFSVALLSSFPTFFGQSFFKILQCHFSFCSYENMEVLWKGKGVKMLAAEWNDVWPVQNSTAIPATKEFQSGKFPSTSQSRLPILRFSLYLLFICYSSHTEL